MTKRLPQAAGALDRNEGRKIIHIRTLVFGVEPIIGRGDRHRLFGDVLAERLFNKPRIDMRGVIGRDDEIGVLRNVCLALDPRVQNTLVERILGKIDDRVADPANDRRYHDLLLVLFLFDPRFVCQFFGFIDPLHGREQFAYRLDLAQRIRRSDSAARVLDGGLQFDEHQRIKPEIGKFVLHHDVGQRAV